jgi:hypothetical protein
MEAAKRDFLAHDFQGQMGQPTPPRATARANGRAERIEQILFPSDRVNEMARNAEQRMTVDLLTERTKNAAEDRARRIHMGRLQL